MDRKKLIGAIVAAFVILFVAGFPVDDAWLGTTYREIRDAGFSFRLEEAIRHRFWLICVSDALYSVCFVWAYAGERRNLGSVKESVRGFDDSRHRRAIND